MPAAAWLALEPGVALAQPAPVAPTVKYRHLTARAWALIAKDPDAHTWEHYIVYGVVTQSDAATGAEMILADVDGVRHTDTYEYPTNTVIEGRAPDFAKVVEGDTFKAKVEVKGSLTYETQAGGETTAPELHADSVKVLVPAP
ncbi:hypothetical protein ACFW9D_09735 [Streptomyces sp. NPDC059524]|uniref:hypothetical protein n=1 Tax=Streptomyces sp. NPDC059524 TaxID=3346856 RepID=UPI0036BBC703